MRKRLLRDGANELEYEIRDIVKKADLVEQAGQRIYWENIGDPIQKNAKIPVWMKEVITDLVQDDTTYGYCHSKGELTTREFLAEKTNALGGVQISANDILFFNGLGDAISKVYQYLTATSRVIGPSPAYSTHSSAEAAHANTEPLTYRLDPNNSWYPDLEQMYLNVKYNPNIVGILIINPDNPTGMVYPREVLEKIVAIAKEFNLFIISDEIYSNITYNGAEALPLAEFIGDVPGIAMKGISKELPWPGARCGWMEFYNRDKDAQFNDLCNTLDNAKMIEVCSTTLPQKAIPKLLGHEAFGTYRKDLNEDIGQRSRIITEILQDIPYLTFNETFGAFYNTIVFKEGALKEGQYLKVDKPEVQQLLDEWIQPGMSLDKQFVYYLLATQGVCVVPLSSFHSELKGFRVTLLEENKELLATTFTKIKNAVIEFCESV
ncbi:MAG: pyridoxal phosphate-dependent aminotransferase [Cytophagales bacterium]|nr:pyridoxal phosphate-dependent aminotransferase [Cytophagales bacterium]